MKRFWLKFCANSLVTMFAGLACTRWRTCAYGNPPGMPCEKTASYSPFLNASTPVAASATTLKITRSRYGCPLWK